MKEGNLLANHSLLIAVNKSITGGETERDITHSKAQLQAFILTAVIGDGEN